MGKSYKQFYCHNTKLVEKKGWPTNDKKGTVVIEDTKNGFHFEIIFGKEPHVSVYKINKNGTLLGKELLEEEVNKRAVELFNKTKEEKPNKKVSAKDRIAYNDRSTYNDIDDFSTKP